MLARTMARKLDPKSKAGFVRSLPRDMSAAEVVSRGKQAGHKLTSAYVYSVRASMNRAAKKRGRPVAGPSSAAARAATAGPRAVTGGGLIAEIERIVERKVQEILTERLGSLFKG